MYTFKTSERNNEKATDFETKSLLYLMTCAKDHDNVDLFIIDCFNDVTGVSQSYQESWDVQSKGVASLTPRKIGAALYTLYANYVSDIDFSHYILFIPPVKLDYVLDSTRDIFDITNFNAKRIEEIHVGLENEISNRKDGDVISCTSTASIDSFLSSVSFVVDNYGKADYIRRIVQFRSQKELDDIFLSRIFDEIRTKQASKKISNVYGKSVSSIGDTLAFEKHLYRKDIELLVVNRIIGNDLFANKGIPLYFYPEIKDMDPEDAYDLLIDCQSQISHTLFNKNNKKSFWILLEEIMCLVTKHPKENIRAIYSQLSMPTKSKVFTLDEISTLYLISVIKEGLKHENS